MTIFCRFGQCIIHCMVHKQSKLRYLKEKHVPYNINKNKQTRLDPQIKKQLENWKTRKLGNQKTEKLDN